MEAELIKYPTNDDWMFVKRIALFTAGRVAKQKPNWEWKHKILLARHSPIRELNYVFILRNVPTWVATHLVRHHVGFQPYVRSQRNDRQSDYDRNAARQDAPIDMMVSLNAEAMMSLANKRLCNLASPETRHLVQLMCNELELKCEQFRGLLVPMCDYHGGVCHEMKPCGKRIWKGMGLDYGNGEAQSDWASSSQDKY